MISSSVARGVGRFACSIGPETEPASVPACDDANDAQSAKPTAARRAAANVATRPSVGKDERYCIEGDRPEEGRGSLSERGGTEGTTSERLTRRGQLRFRRNSVARGN